LQLVDLVKNGYQLTPDEPEFKAISEQQKFTRLNNFISEVTSGSIGVSVH
jgi:hypothetical protein